MAIEEILKKLNREMPEAKVKTVTGAIRFFEGEFDLITEELKDRMHYQDKVTALEGELEKLEEQTRICVEMAETIQKEHKNIRGYEKEALMNVEGRLTDIKVKIWGLQNKLSRRS